VVKKAAVLSQGGKKNRRAGKGVRNGQHEIVHLGRRRPRKIGKSLPESKTNYQQSDPNPLREKMYNRPRHL